MLQLADADGKSENKSLSDYEKGSNAWSLHWAHTNAFRLNDDIRASSSPIERINEHIVNKSLFSFSFVRHPYTR